MRNFLILLAFLVAGKAGAACIIQELGEPDKPFLAAAEARLRQMGPSSIKLEQHAESYEDVYTIVGTPLRIDLIAFGKDLREVRIYSVTPPLPADEDRLLALAAFTLARYAPASEEAMRARLARTLAAHPAGSWSDRFDTIGVLITRSEYGLYITIGKPAC